MRDQPPTSPARLAALLLLLLLACQLWACQSDATPGAGDGAVTASASAPGGVQETVYVLPPIEASETPTRVAEHMHNMDLLLTPLAQLALTGTDSLEICGEFGRELTSYFELARSDFEVASERSPTDAQRQSVTEAYITLSNMAARCLSDDGTRRTLRTVMELTDGLRIKDPAAADPNQGHGHDPSPGGHHRVDGDHPGATNGAAAPGATNGAAAPGTNGAAAPGTNGAAPVTP